MLDTATVTTLAYGGGSGVAVLAFAYKLMRFVRGDQRKDRVDAAADDLRNDLLNQINTLRLDVKSLVERCDNFAAERNVAIANAAELRATVDGLRSRLEDVIKDRDRVQGEMTNVRERNDALVQENVRLQASVKTLTEMITRITRMPNYDWNNLIEGVQYSQEKDK